MNCSLVQIILAARNNDAEGWMNILVFVILAAFWAIGGILKARANKLNQKGQGLPERKPQPRPTGERVFAPKHPNETASAQSRRLPSRPVQKQPPAQIQPPRRKVMRPEPAVRRSITTKTEQDLLLETLEPLEAPKLPLPRPEVQVELEPAETHRAKPVVEPLLDFDGPDKLKRAILHYEILGKPLSLRSPYVST